MISPVDSETAAISSPASLLRVLCVEDVTAHFELLEVHLEKAGLLPDLDLERAETLGEALEAAGRNGPFDLVLLDLSLPDSRGARTFEAMQEALPDCPVVVMTGQGEPDLGRKLVRVGAEDFLPKEGLDADVLRRTLQHAIERKRSRVELQHANAELRRLNHELEETRLQLIQAEKLDSLERLASGVAHEIKNPLATLQMGVDYFSRKPKVSADDGKIIGSMQTSIDRANRIIMDMVEFSRAKDLEFRLDNVNLVVRRACNLVDPDLRASDLNLELELEDNLPAVRMDPLKMEQVLVNLLVNAIEASPMCGTIRVRTGLIPREERLDLREVGSGAEEELLQVEVRDWGGGIEEKDLPKVFDPFFTTKEKTNATGLGLSVSRTIVSLHDGTLLIENAEDGGVAARVILPVPAG